MTESESGANVLIDFTHRLILIRCMGSAMIPVRLRMRAEVFPAETAEEIDFDVTFAKIKFWLETIVARSIVFCRSNLAAVEMLLAVEGKPIVTNHLMITPYEPTDEHLAALFQSKMQALSGNTMNFGCVRIETEESGLVFTYVGDWEVDLPSMQDWFDIKPYYFDVPWWQRDDASTLDVMAENAALRAELAATKSRRSSRRRTVEG